MVEYKLILAAVLLVALATVSGRPRSDNNYKVVCLYESVAAYRTGNATYDISNIRPDLCTHLIYGYASINSYNNRIESADPDIDLPAGKNGYLRFVNQTISGNSGTIPMLAVGGSAESSATFSLMASKSQNRQIFIQSALDFLTLYGFKGLDINWQYPGDTKTEDKNNFASLLSEAKLKFEAQGYLLTTTISGRNNIIDVAYDVVKVSSNVDFLNVIAYDYHDDWGNWTGANSPLYPDPDDGETQDNYYNVNYTIHYLNELGAPYNKLVLGMAAHGHSYVQNPRLLTTDTGILNYYEICQLLQQPDWSTWWNPSSHVPFAFNKNKGISYDDDTSLRDKSNFVLSLGLAGGQLSAIDEDDYSNFCDNGTYPLLNTIYQRLIGQYTTTTVTTPTPKTSPGVATTINSRTTEAESTVAPPQTTSHHHPTTINSRTTEAESTVAPPQTTSHHHPTSVAPPSTGHTDAPRTTTEKPQTPTDAPHTRTVPTSAAPTGAPQTPTAAPATTAEPEKSTHEVPRTSTEPAPTTTKAKPTTVAPFACTEEGYVADPSDCSTFYDCEPNGNTWIITTYTCSEGLIFNPATDNCDFSKNVPDCHADV